MRIIVGKIGEGLLLLLGLLAFRKRSYSTIYVVKIKKRDKPRARN